MIVEVVIWAGLLSALLSAVAGKFGWWRKDGAAYKFRTWRLRLSATPVDTTTFVSNGFSEFIAGFVTGEVTAQGLFDPNKPLTIGDVMELSLGIGRENQVSYAIEITVTLLDVTWSTAVDKAGEVEIMARTNGEFTPTFVQAA